MQAIPPEQAASVGSAEMALCNMSELIMLGIAAVWSEPRHFGLLVNLSAVAVSVGACLFLTWARRIPDTQFSSAQAKLAVEEA